MQFIVQPSSLKQQIADEIKRRIICGDLEFGQKISENSFAQELGTKRTPVREAFILLQGEELVNILPQKGTYVFTITEEELSQIIEHRFILESTSLQALRKKNTCQQFIDEIAEILRCHRAAVAETDVLKCEKYDSTFHERIIDYSDNKFIISSYKIISDRAKAIRSRTIGTDRLRIVLNNHEEIYRLLLENNMRQCKSTLQRHLNNIQVSVRKPGIYERVFQKALM